MYIRQNCKTKYTKLQRQTKATDNITNTEVRKTKMNEKGICEKVKLNLQKTGYFIYRYRPQPTKHDDYKTMQNQVNTLVMKIKPIVYEAPNRNI